MAKKYLTVLIFSFFLQFTSPGSFLFKRYQQNPATFQVIGNSTTGFFSLTYKNENKGPLTIMVFDATGKIINLKNIKDFNGELKDSIDLSAYPKGIYVFEIEGNNFRDTKRVIYQ